MTWNVPNTLTILRLLAAPGIVLSFLALTRPWADMVALVLFCVASVTDWVDGHLARKWGQTSRFGAMLDPIADKAMVVIALAAVAALYGMNLWVLLPTTAILFREVFVSGLREYLREQAGLLQVTRLAKWKTTLQMTAIAVLLAQGIFAHYVGMWSYGMDAQIVGQILSGQQADELGLRGMYRAMVVAQYGGLGLLWLAAVLTVVTGWDYFAKSLPYLREDT